MYDLSLVNNGTYVNITYDTPLKGPEKMVEVLGKVSYSMAKEINDIDAEHANIYSSLEANPVNNLTGATFLVFRVKTNDGFIKRAVPDLWIRNVAVVKQVKVKFTVDLDSLEDIQHVTKALASRGLNDVNYEIITTE